MKEQRWLRIDRIHTNRNEDPHVNSVTNRDIAQR